MRILTTFVIALIFLVSALALSAQTPVRIGVYNFAPLVSIQDNKPNGFFIDLTEEIARRENWRVEYVPGSFQESLDSLKRGEIDVLVSTGYSEDRSQYLDFSDQPIFVVSGVLYVKSGSSITTPFDLAGRTIGCLRGAMVTQGFKDYLKDFGVSCTYREYDEYEDIMKAVSEGKVDAGIFTQLLGAELSSSYSTAGTSIYFSPVSMTYAVKKGQNSDLLATISRQIRQMKEDPQSLYYYSYATWINPPPKFKMPLWLVASIGFAGLFVLFLIVTIRFMRNQVCIKTLSLRQANTDLNKAQQYAQIGSWTWELQNDELVWSDEMYRLFGIKKEEFSGVLKDVIPKSIHPDDRQRVHDSNNEVIEKGIPKPLEYRILLPDGAI